MPIRQEGEGGKREGKKDTRPRKRRERRFLEYLGDDFDHEKETRRRVCKRKGEKKKGERTLR